GQEGCGKSWLFQHLVRETIAEDGAVALPVHLSDLQPSACASLDAFAREIAGRIVRAAGGPPAWVESVWGGFGGPATKLNRLMEQHILHRAAGRVILAIDRADAIFNTAIEDDFFGLLRAWADDQEEPW